MSTDVETFSQLEYDSATGLLRWKANKKRALVGVVAGTVTTGGYIQIHVNGRRYAAHRLAWFMCYGEWPGEMLDHIDRNKQNNRICNLRLATRSQNGCNRTKQRNSSTGFKGVFRVPSSNKFQALCKIEGVNHYLGIFTTPEEADLAYEQFARKHHGEFFNANLSQGDMKMARPKSVVLSKDEKKAVVAELKAKLKAAKDAAKQLAGVRKEADKAYAAAGKAHVAALKQNYKESAAAAKIVSDLEAQLVALTEKAEA